jgi:hypothetical protein
MKVAPGAVFWICVERGVVQARVLEIESKAQQCVRLRDCFGATTIRNVEELHLRERDALRARCDQEAFWAHRYRAQSEECLANLTRFRHRLAQLDAPPQAVTNYNRANALRGRANA